MYQKVSGTIKRRAPPPLRSIACPGCILIRNEAKHHGFKVGHANWICGLSSVDRMDFWSSGIGKCFPPIRHSVVWGLPSLDMFRGSLDSHRGKCSSFWQMFFLSIERMDSWLRPGRPTTDQIRAALLLVRCLAGSVTYNIKASIVFRNPQKDLGINKTVEIHAFPITQFVQLKTVGNEAKPICFV